MYKIITFVHMKHFWFVFSLFLIMLSVLPCSDAVECKDSLNTEVSNHDDHDQHSHNSEQCPPFCSCACCGIQITTFENTTFFFTENHVFTSQKAKINWYQSIYLSKISDKIWQPPKINA
jgi:hypothetical protein